MSLCTIILKLRDENRLRLKRLTIWLSFTLATRLGGCWNRYRRNCRSTSRRFRGSGCLLYPTIHRNCKPLCCCNIPLIALFCLLFSQSTEKHLDKIIIFYKLPWGPDYQIDWPQSQVTMRNSFKNKKTITLGCHIPRGLCILFCDSRGYLILKFKLERGTSNQWQVNLAFMQTHFCFLLLPLLINPRFLQSGNLNLQHICEEEKTHQSNQHSIPGAHKLDHAVIWS